MVQQLSHRCWLLVVLGHSEVINLIGLTSPKARSVAVQPQVYTGTVCMH